MLEQRALGSERIQIRRLDIRMTGRAQAIASQLVTDDQNDIWVSHGSTSYSAAAPAEHPAPITASHDSKAAGDRCARPYP